MLITPGVREGDDALPRSALGFALFGHLGLGIQRVAGEKRLGKGHLTEAEVGDDRALGQLRRRQPDELRAVSLERGVVKYAEGSCFVKFGDTHVLVTATLEERLPPWLKPVRIRRTELHLENQDNGSCIDGYATTGNVLRGGRRTAALLDDLGKLAAYHRRSDYLRQVREQYAADLLRGEADEPDCEQTLEALRSVERVQRLTKVPAALQAALATDAGSRRLGELGIGTNPAIDRATGSTLLDEKIAGTVHLALGRSYPETGAANSSALHWDLICDLREGGRLTADGEEIDLATIPSIRMFDKPDPAVQ